MDPAQVSVNTLLEYLYDLHVVKNRAWSTVGVHRSAISSLLQPLESHPVGEHPLVARFMRALFLSRPPAIQPRWTWDMATVLTCIKDWGLPQALTLRRLTWKLAFLVAVFSARRMADLPLLKITNDFLQVSAGSAVFQPAFGAKQDRPGHQNPLVVLRAYDDTRLCPVAHLNEYLRRTRRLDRPDTLFLTTTLPPRSAAKGTIKRWILHVLREAGVQGTPGSTRAAATSFALARNISLNTVMNAADWARSTTMFRHYMRLLPAEVLARVASSAAANVQDAVLDALD
jgi:hypothetical protein